MGSWAGGSTRAWRRTRAAVFRTKGTRCTLLLPGCTVVATQVHHVLGREVSGDDPRWLTPACGPCNLAVGDPAHDPPARPRTRW